jgi:hypothetical protein
MAANHIAARANTLRSHPVIVLLVPATAATLPKYFEKRAITLPISATTDELILMLLSQPLVSDARHWS